MPRNPLNFQRCNAKNHSHSVDADLQEIVAILSVAFLPIKAAKIMIMAKCRCTAQQLSRM